MLDLIKRLEALDDDLSDHIAFIGGCSDGGCIIMRPVGQHTNGSCRCAYDRMKMQRYAHFMNRYRTEINIAILKAKEASDGKASA